MGTLKAILHQRIVRQTMHNHHKHKKNAPQLRKTWENGETILEISKKIDYPPVMVAWLILEQLGTNRSKFREMIRNPEKIRENRLKQEITGAVEKDIVYSPQAIADQVKRSKKVEEKLGKWLQKQKIPYIDEQEAKKKNHLKTPDYLLKKPLEYKKQRINWVECKASFGDEYEIKRDHRKQLRHYVELYGKGMVVYWDGYLDQLKLEDIIITSSKPFK